jgi:hypothetical protein
MRKVKDARAWDKQVCELRPCVQAGRLTTRRNTRTPRLCFKLSVLGFKVLGFKVLGFKVLGFTFEAKSRLKRCVVFEHVPVREPNRA